MQYLEAKNNKESLERRLATANAQLGQSIVKAPFTGSIDAIPAKLGEMAQAGMPLMRIVSPEDVYIKADVSERFIGKFKKGDEVDIYFPSQDQSLSSDINSVGQVINNQNRTFAVEVNLPGVTFPVKPNQVTVLNLMDYQNDAALVVPTRLVQRDDQGTFVFMVAEEADKKVARKVHVTTGISYDGHTEVTAGLGSRQGIDRQRLPGAH